MIPADSILGIATIRRHLLVKGCHATSWFELNGVRTDTGEHSRDVVPFIHAASCPFRLLRWERSGG